MKNFLNKIAVFTAGRKFRTAAVWTFAAVLLLINLGSGGLPAAQEGRTAIITRNMLRSGDWLSLQAPADSVRYEKPIGHYWLCVLTGRLFGLDRAGENSTAAEWAVRLPSALAALLALWAASRLATLIYDEETGRWTIIILSSMNTFLRLGRLAHIDMPLTASFTLALYFFYTGYWRERKSNFRIYGFYLMLGWGVLLKGPLPVLLGGLAVLTLMCCFRDWKMPWKLRPLSGGLLFLLTVLPWYVSENLRSNGELFEEFIMNQNVRRFTGNAGYRNDEFMPIYYYLYTMPLGMLPWSIAGIAGLLCGWKKLLKRQFSAGTALLLVTVLTGLAFFSLSSLKRGDYVLPLYPAAAVLTAAAVTRFSHSKFRLPVWTCWPAAVIALLAAGVWYAFSFGWIRLLAEKSLDKSFKVMSKYDALNCLLISDFFAANRLLTAVGVLLALALLARLLICLQRNRLNAVLRWLTVIVFAAFLGYFTVIERAGDKHTSVKGLAWQIRKTVPAEESIYMRTFNTELIFFMDRKYTGTPGNCRYAVIDPRHQLKAMKTQWEVLAITPEQHHYPQAFLQKKENNENNRR